VGRANGLDQESVVSCDNNLTVPTSVIGRHIGHLLVDQAKELVEAIRATVDLP
jgi:mRNA interferase MazF